MTDKIISLDDLFAEVVRPLKKAAKRKPATSAAAAPAPVNPHYRWSATAIVFGLRYVTCDCCNLSYPLPNPPLCEWKRPFHDETILTDKFPTHYNTLPKRTAILSIERTNGCFNCLNAVPSSFGSDPMKGIILAEETLPAGLLENLIPDTPGLIDKAEELSAAAAELERAPLATISLTNPYEKEDDDVDG